VRFQKYRNNNSIEKYTEVIKRDCKSWLSAVKNCSRPFYRGVDLPLLSDVAFLKKKVRANRRPMNATKEEQLVLDRGFQKEFGWKARSNGVFITSNPMEAMNYGNLFYFFAIENFKYVWSPKIEDLYTDIPLVIVDLRNRKEYKKSVDKLHDLEQIPKTFYRDSGLCQAASARNEVIVNCKTYYILEVGILEGTLDQKYKQLKKMLY
jgi:hypothetical protein